jgi:endonuclease/exonuclease/phosphatase family metal-dependent hydrolase
VRLSDSVDLTTPPAARHAVLRPALLAAVLAGLILPIGLQPATAAAPARPAVQGVAGAVAVAPGSSSGARKAAKDPMRLREAGSKPARIQVAWKATKNTKKYLVEAFADIRLKKLITSKRTKKTTAWIGGGKVKEGQKLWIRVTTIDRPKKLKSAKIKVYTGAKAPAAPKGVTVRATSPSSIHVEWASASRATGYSVQLAATPTGAPVYSKRVEAPARALDLTGIWLPGLGLSPEFFVTVKADRKRQAFATSAAAPAAMPFPAPPWAPAFNVTVGSYNVLGATYSDALDRSYWDRIPFLAGGIRDMGADIVAVQEAAWTLKAGYPDRPVRLLAGAAGMTLALTPGSRLACAATSNHILYNSAVFAVEACGEDSLTVDVDYPCTSTWAVMRHIPTGQPMLVISTHLTVGATLNSLRLQETSRLVQLVAEHNPAGYPVVVAGDFNGAAIRTTTSPPTVMAAAGYIGTDLVAPEVVNGELGTTNESFGGVKRDGTRIDFIFTDPKVAVHSFAVRYAEPAGVQPSDHYPITANLTVYP